jgi:hypothetical protein
MPFIKGASPAGVRERATTRKRFATPCSSGAIRTGALAWLGLPVPSPQAASGQARATLPRKSKSSRAIMQVKWLGAKPRISEARPRGSAVGFALTAPGP